MKATWCKTEYNVWSLIPEGGEGEIEEKLAIIRKDGNYYDIGFAILHMEISAEYTGESLEEAKKEVERAIDLENI